MKQLTLRKDMEVCGCKLLQLLGTGTSGEVWSALGSDGTIVALKIYSGTEEVSAKAEHEYTMACSFDNQNILKPLGISAFDSHPVIKLPYCEGRSVDGISAHIGEGMLWQLIRDISNALIDIQEKGYGHYDIKPSNILWDGHQFLLTDFGSCAKAGESIPESIATDASSYRFDAPELNVQRSESCDIWSLGATIFYLYMGCYVFNGLGGRAQRKDSPVPYMRKSMAALSELVQKCLDYNPEKRPSAIAVKDVAIRELEALGKSISQRRIRQVGSNDTEATQTAEFWPDEMIE